MALKTTDRPFDDGYLVHPFVEYRPIVADANSVDAAMVYWLHQLHPLQNYLIEPIANVAYYHLHVAADAVALVHLDLSHTVDTDNMASHFARNSLCAVHLLYMDMGCT